MIDFRSHSANQVGSGAGMAVAEPAGAVLSDLLMAFVVAHDLNQVIPVPAGWNEAFYDGAGDMAVGVQWVRRGSSAPTLTWVFTNGSFERRVDILCFSLPSPNSNLITDLEFTQLGVGAYDPPPVDGVAGHMAVAACLAGPESADWVAPAGYTLRSPASGVISAVATKKLTVTGVENASAFVPTPEPSFSGGFGVVIEGAAIAPRRPRYGIRYSGRGVRRYVK